MAQDSENCTPTILFDQILRVCQFAVIKVHVALRRRDVGVPQQPTGVFDPLLAADFRPAFVPGQVQHQIPGQASQVAEPGMRRRGDFGIRILNFGFEEAGGETAFSDPKSEFPDPKSSGGPFDRRGAFPVC